MCIIYNKQQTNMRCMFTQTDAVTNKCAWHVHTDRRLHKQMCMACSHRQTLSQTNVHGMFSQTDAFTNKYAWHVLTDRRAYTNKYAWHFYTDRRCHKYMCMACSHRQTPTQIIALCCNNCPGRTHHQNDPSFLC